MFLKIGAPKMYATSSKDVNEEVHFLKCCKHATLRKQPLSQIFFKDCPNGFMLSLNLPNVGVVIL